MLTLDGLHPALAPYFSYAAEWMRQGTGGTFDIRGRPVGGVVPIVTSTWRSIQEQQELWINAGANPYPVARPGDSAHNVTHDGYQLRVNGLGRPASLAVDSDVPDAHMGTWIAIRKAVGWSVPDNDEVHAGYPGWRDYVAR